MDALPQRGIFLFDGFHLDHRGLFRRDERGVLTPVAIGGRALDLLWALIERDPAPDVGIADRMEHGVCDR